MEVAGLVLGAVGIAGVIGAFKDAVDVFGLIADSKQLGRDYEVLETKLDIEKTVLLHWANRTKLLQPDYDRRLDEPSTHRAVVKILSSIHLLLSDAEPLRRRYGLEKSVIKEEHTTASTLIHELAAVGNHPDQVGIRGARPGIEVDPSPISERRMKSFITDFQSLQLRMNARQKESSKRSKLRWVVADKAKIEVLIQDLAYFTTKLHAVLPAANDPLQMLVDEDLRTVRNLRGLKILLEASAGRRAAVASSTQRAISKLCEDRILHRLCEPLNIHLTSCLLIPCRVQDYRRKKECYFARS